MGIYIKGVTKPQLMKVIINSTEFMPNDFEVIELKTPHGRLIDADKAIRDFHKYGISHMWDATDLPDIMGESPTVIEAEVE